MLPAPNMNFGDVYSHLGKEYVFLAKTKDSWFVGHLLNERRSKYYNKLLLGAVRRNKGEENKAVYFHVDLETKELGGRVLHLRSSEREPLSGGFEKNEVVLLEKDLLNIKKAILEEGAPVPPALVEEIEKLNEIN